MTISKAIGMTSQRMGPFVFAAGTGSVTSTFLTLFSGAAINGWYVMRNIRFAKTAGAKFTLASARMEFSQINPLNSTYTSVFGASHSGCTVGHPHAITMPAADVDGTATGADLVYPTLDLNDADNRRRLPARLADGYGPKIDLSQVGIATAALITIPPLIVYPSEKVLLNIVNGAVSPAGSIYFDLDTFTSGV